MGSCLVSRVCRRLFRPVGVRTHPGMGSGIHRRRRPNGSSVDGNPGRPMSSKQMFQMNTTETTVEGELERRRPGCGDKRSSVRSPGLRPARAVRRSVENVPMRHGEIPATPDQAETCDRRTVVQTASGLRPDRPKHDTFPFVRSDGFDLYLVHPRGRSDRFHCQHHLARCAQ